MLFPLIVIGFMYLWPWVERWFTGDREYHNVLDRPRDAPWRTAIGIAMIVWVVLVFVAGSADRIYMLFNMSYATQLWVFRVLVFVAPAVSGAIAYRTCRELKAGERVERDRHSAEAEARLSAIRSD